MTEPPAWKSPRSHPYVGRVSATFDGLLSVPVRKACQLEDPDASAARTGGPFEQELKTVRRMLQKLCLHMGVNVDSSKQEVQSFSKTTDVHRLATELEDKL